MTKVYVVTKGAYSDFRVIGVCSTEEAAKSYANAYAVGSYDDVGYEDHELDALPAPPKGMKPYRVVMDAKGNLHAGEFSFKGVERIQDDPETEWGSWDHSGEWFYAEMWAKDEAHAIKIANERRTVALSPVGGKE